MGLPDNSSLVRLDDSAAKSTSRALSLTDAFLSDADVNRLVSLGVILDVMSTMSPSVAPNRQIESKPRTSKLNRSLAQTSSADWLEVGLASGASTESPSELLSAISDENDFSRRNSLHRITGIK